MFDVDFRDQVQAKVLQLAEDDLRVVAAAVVGSRALGEGDRYSDLDLTFAARDGQDVLAVLDDWSDVLAAENGAVRLFDLASGSSVYRVFLLPGALQVDLSVTPESAFGARGGSFRLLWGSAVESHSPEERAPEEIYGYAVHHAVRARVSIERHRLLQAEYWITSLRQEVIALACARLELTAWQARGADQLPRAVVDRSARCLVRSLETEELRRALTANIDALLGERGQAASLAMAVADDLHALAAT